MKAKTCSLFESFLCVFEIFNRKHPKLSLFVTNCSLKIQLFVKKIFQLNNTIFLKRILYFLFILKLGFFEAKIGSPYKSFLKWASYVFLKFLSESTQNLLFLEHIGQCPIPLFSQIFEKLQI